VNEANPAFPVPDAVVKYVRQVFRACDRELGLRIERVPGVHEPALDMALIDMLAMFASPVSVTPEWTVRIDTHFLGGRRHYYTWEVADIGLLVYLRLGGKLYATKVALLQSKRLNPSSGVAVDPETKSDFGIGFARLMPAKSAVSFSTPTSFRFEPSSKYQALRAGDHQAKAIAEFEQHKGIPIHYLFYNPWNIPAQMNLPLTGVPKLSGAGNAGARVVPAADIRGLLAGKATNYSPSFKEIEGLVGHGKHLAGWRLDYFVADLVMGCKQGMLLDEGDLENMNALFFSRSGPISAAIAIGIDKSD
jgi:hypothetical protein